MEHFFKIRFTKCFTQGNKFKSSRSSAVFLVHLWVKAAFYNVKHISYQLCWSAVLVTVDCCLTLKKKLSPFLSQGMFQCLLLKEVRKELLKHLPLFSENLTSSYYGCHTTHREQFTHLDLGSSPLHQHAWRLVWDVYADIQCLVFIKHGSVNYGQTSPLWSHVSQGHYSRSLAVCSDTTL